MTTRLMLLVLLILGGCASAPDIDTGRTFTYASAPGAVREAHAKRPLNALVVQSGSSQAHARTIARAFAAQFPGSRWSTLPSSEVRANPNAARSALLMEPPVFATSGYLSSEAASREFLGRVVAELTSASTHDLVVTLDVTVQRTHDETWHIYRSAAGFMPLASTTLADVTWVAELRRRAAADGFGDVQFAEQIIAYLR